MNLFRKAILFNGAYTFSAKFILTKILWKKHFKTTILLYNRDFPSFKFFFLENYESIKNAILLLTKSSY